MPISKPQITAAIPLPTDDPASIHTTLLALKQAVDVLTGAQPGVAAARCFVQALPPEHAGLNVGDFWVKTIPSYALQVWTGVKWIGAAAYPTGPAGGSLAGEYPNPDIPPP